MSKGYCIISGQIKLNIVPFTERCSEISRDTMEFNITAQVANAILFNDYQILFYSTIIDYTHIYDLDRCFIITSKATYSLYLHTCLRNTSILVV